MIRVTVKIDGVISQTRYFENENLVIPFLKDTVTRQRKHPYFTNIESIKKLNNKIKAEDIASQRLALCKRLAVKEKIRAEYLDKKCLKHPGVISVSIESYC